MSLLLLIFSASRSGLSFSCHNFSLFAEVRVGWSSVVQVPFPLCVSHCAVLEDPRLHGEGDTWDWGGGLSGGGLHFGVGDGNPDAGTRELCAEVARSSLVALP